MALIPISIEYLAWTFIALFIIKLLFVIFKPKAWMNFSNGVYSNKTLSTIVFLVLAYLSLDILLDSGVTYVQILATSFFLMFLIGLSFIPYNKQFLKLKKEISKEKHFIKKSWVAILIWALISLLALKELVY